LGNVNTDSTPGVTKRRCPNPLWIRAPYRPLTVYVGQRSFPE
jgi:hypothetical protein